jgi:hypothetical protein
MGLLFRRKRPAFHGIPYDSKMYYASGLAGRVADVRRDVGVALTSGGIAGTKVEPWSIKMNQWFSESRDYLVVRYEGVWVYLLVIAFGTDLYASWITFFKLGCLHRLLRFGRSEPSHLDVDDLEMLGQASDLYLGNVLDQTMRNAGANEEAIQEVFRKSRRKRFVKAVS